MATRASDPSLFTTDHKEAAQPVGAAVIRVEVLYDHRTVLHEPSRDHLHGGRGGHVGRTTDIKCYYSGTRKWVKPLI